MQLLWLNEIVNVIERNLTIANCAIIIVVVVTILLGVDRLKARSKLRCALLRTRKITRELADATHAYSRGTHFCQAKFAFTWTNLPNSWKLFYRSFVCEIPHLAKKRKKETRQSLNVLRNGRVIRNSRTVWSKISFRRLLTPCGTGNR